MTPKKEGRFSPDLPIRLVSVRFVYKNVANPGAPIYGEWMDLMAVYRETMFAHPDYQVQWVEFDTKEVK